jgi:hypothetical protein
VNNVLYPFSAFPVFYPFNLISEKTMKIIKTKYLSPTNHHGARVKAIAGKLSATIPWDYSLNGMPNHTAAVKALKDKHNLQWDTCNMGYGHDEIYCYFTLNSVRVSA